VKTVLEVKRNRLGLRWRFRDYQNGQIINPSSQPYNRRRDLVDNIYRVSGLRRRDLRKLLPARIKTVASIVIDLNDRNYRMSSWK